MDLFEGAKSQNLTLIFRSDDGKTWHYVSELFPCFWGKMFIHKGELYMLSVSTEYGDLLVHENWSFSAPAHYNCDWKRVPSGYSYGNIEGTLVVFPDGKLYNVMRYEMNYMKPDRGLILAYKVNTEDFDAPLEFSHAIKFDANASKFMMKNPVEFT